MHLTELLTDSIKCRQGALLLGKCNQCPASCRSFFLGAGGRAADGIYCRF